MQSAQLANVAVGLAGQAIDVGGVAYVAHLVPDGTPVDGIRKLALDIRGQIPADPAGCRGDGGRAGRPAFRRRRRQRGGPLPRHRGWQR